MASKSTNRTGIWIYFLLIATTIMAYGQVIHFEFVGFDDPAFTTENDIVAEGFTWKGVKTVFNNPDYYCMQLSLLSHMLDSELFGFDAGKHHLINLLFHIINVVLLYFFLKKSTGNLWPSALVAILFAIHPMNVESVAWIAERRNVLSTLFWFLATITYCNYSESPNFARYFLIIVLFVLGLLSKAMLVTFPFALLLLDYWPLNRFRFKTDNIDHHSTENLNSKLSRNPIISFLRDNRLLLIEKIPLLAISILAGYLSVLAIKNTGGSPGIGGLVPTESLPLDFRIANALVAYAKYVWHAFYPLNLSLNYPIDKTLPLWQIILSASLIIFISLTAYINRINRPWIIVGWLWYLGTLVPVIGIVQIGHQAMADRYAYIPLIGIFIIVAWSVEHWLRRNNSRLSGSATTTAVVVIAMFTTITAVQTHYWKDTISLFKRVIKITPEYTVAYYNLGLAFKRQENPDKAFEYFKKAVDIYPEFAEANFNLGLLYAEKQPDKAIAYYLKAISKKPELTEARFNLANLIVEKGYFEEGEKLYLEILASHPDDVETLNALGRTYLSQGKTDQSIRHYTQAVLINPHSAKSHHSLGMAFYQSGSMEKAKWHYTEAIRLDSNYASAHNNMAILLIKQGKYNAAATEFQRALDIEPDNFQALFNIALLYQKIGKEEGSVYYLRRAVEIRPEYLPPVRLLVSLYLRQGKPSAAILLLKNTADHQSGNAAICYDIARLSARLQRVEDSIFWLKKAIDRGYDNWEKIRNDIDLDGIRHTAEYKVIERNMATRE